MLSPSLTLANFLVSFDLQGNLCTVLKPGNEEVLVCLIAKGTRHVADVSCHLGVKLVTEDEALDQLTAGLSRRNSTILRKCDWL